MGVRGWASPTVKGDDQASPGQDEEGVSEVGGEAVAIPTLKIALGIAVGKRTLSRW